MTPHLERYLYSDDPPCFMTDTTAHIHTDIEEMKRDLAFIKHVLTEEYELSPRAIRALAKARAAPREEYVSHEDAKKILLR